MIYKEKQIKKENLRRKQTYWLSGDGLKTVFN